MLGHTQQSPEFPPQWKQDQAFSACTALHTVIRGIPYAAAVYILCSVGNWRHWGRGRRTHSGYPPSTSSLGATRTQTHVDPTPHCRLFCHVLGPLLRRYSGGPAAFEAGIRGRVLEHRRQTCHHPGWAVRGRHPDTHCRTVPCSACLACLAGSHQSPVGQETE